MKRAAIGFGLATITFMVGYLASSQPNEPKSIDPIVDYAVYTVTLDELFSEPDRYEGKIVRIKATYEETRNSIIGNIYSGQKWLRAVCVADWESCSRLGIKEVVEVAGRFYPNTHDPHPLQRGGKIGVLEISEVISPPESGGRELCYDENGTVRLPTKSELAKWTTKYKESWRNYGNRPSCSGKPLTKR